MRLGLPRTPGPVVNSRRWELLSPVVAFELGSRFSYFMSPLDSTHRRCPINVALNKGRAFLSLGGGILPVSGGATFSEV